MDALGRAVRVEPRHPHRVELAVAVSVDIPIGSRKRFEMAQDAPVRPEGVVVVGVKELVVPVHIGRNVAHRNADLKHSRRRVVACVHEIEVVGSVRPFHAVTEKQRQQQDRETTDRENLVTPNERFLYSHDGITSPCQTVVICSVLVVGLPAKGLLLPRKT